MKARVLTAIALIVVVLGALLCTSVWPVALLAIVAGWLCAAEVGVMAKQSSSYPWLQAILIALGAPFFVADYSGRVQWMWMGIAASVVGILTMVGTVRSQSKPLMAGLGSALWPTGGLICLLVLHQSSPSPGLWNVRNPALLGLVPLWIGDSAAYFVGRGIGKTPLAPTISPKKTVEGAIANLIFSIAGGFAIGWLIHAPILVGVLAGMAAGILGQAGDLFESWVKRASEIKDSGSILPGHGGMMDRLDSALFTAPIVALLVTYLWR